MPIFYQNSNPRIDIEKDIRHRRSDTLMVKAAQMHGHYCPGLALGIMAAVYAMNYLEAESDGMEDLLAITETNNCFSDGIQFVTGCSFGNNALIFKDLGKAAFTLTRRDGKGIRVCSKPNSRQVIQETFPDHQNLYKKVVQDQNRDPKLMTQYRKKALERAFGTLTIDFDKLFDVQNVKVDVPQYAKIHDSHICSTCSESTMASRTVSNQEGVQCYECANHRYLMLDGNGIHLKQ